MTRYVITYYEDLNSAQHRPERQLMAIWKDQWQRLGWSPMVLGLADSQSHPQHPDYVRIVSGYPTVNAPDYELACWRRWLAYDQFADIHPDVPMVFMDYDVFPLADFALPKRSAWLHPARTPVLFDHGPLIKAMIKLAVDCAERGIVRQQGRMHVSDYTLAQAACEGPLEILCTDWPEMAPMVHIPNGPMERDKVTIAHSLIDRAWGTAQVLHGIDTPAA